MTFEVMRDTLFSLGSADAKMRIPVFSHQQKAILKNREMQCNAKKIREPTLPSEVHPQGIFRESGTCKPWKLVKKFKNPEGFPRPADSIVGTSGFQHRLDHLNNERAIPAAMTPVSFAKGVPIKESDAHNGIFFNRWIAREHANLVVEAGAYMSRVPGVAGGDYRKVPASFRRQSALRELSESERLMMMEEDAAAGAGATAAAPASDDELRCARTTAGVCARRERRWLRRGGREAADGRGGRRRGAGGARPEARRKSRATLRAARSGPGGGASGDLCAGRVGGGV